MYIYFLILILIITCQCKSMELEYADARWNSAVYESQKILEKQGNIYADPPKSEHASLVKELVTNTPYWKKMESADQKEKDAAFQALNKLTFDENKWALERYHLAAAAQINAKLGLTQALGEAVWHGDEPLCGLLLEKGANPNSLRGISPYLHFVKTVSLANLFLKAKADVCLKATLSKDTLLHKVASDNEYEAELIPLYRKQGLSPFEVSDFKASPLSKLLFGIEEMHWGDRTDCIIKKARYLLAELSPQQTLCLLHKCGGDFPLLTIFEELEKNNFIFSSGHRESARKKLYAYLQEQKKLAEEKIGKIGNYHYVDHEDYVSRPPQRWIDLYINNINDPDKSFYVDGRTGQEISLNRHYIDIDSSDDED